MRYSVALTCAAALAVAGTSAAADASALNGRLSGKTLTVSQHGPTGRLVGISRVYLAPTGGYTSDNTAGQKSKGTWRTTDSALCLTATDPLPPPEYRKENCLAVGKLDRWSVTSAEGVTLQYDIAGGFSTRLERRLPDRR